MLEYGKEDGRFLAEECKLRYESKGFINLSRVKRGEGRGKSEEGRMKEAVKCLCMGSIAEGVPC